VFATATPGGGAVTAVTADGTALVIAIPGGQPA
jgi:hypothetical protein